DVLERLALIALGRAAGFSLEEIGHMFSPEGKPRIDRQVLADKAQDLDRTIRQLTAMRDGLRHAAVCPAPSHMECPTFRRILRAASSGALEARKERAPKPPPKPRAAWPHAFACTRCVPQHAPCPTPRGPPPRTGTCGRLLHREMHTFDH